MPAAPPTIDELEEHLRVFSLPLGVSLAQVKERWSFMVQVSHPDIVPGKLKDKASEEMIRINNAWEGVNTWFKANPDTKTTPLKESSSTSSSDSENNNTQQSNTTGGADDDDWEAFERNQRARWTAQDGVSMAELDLSRRRNMIISERRNLIFKGRIGIGVMLFLGGFIFTGPGASSGTFDCWFVILIAYLIWQFHPKARKKTEEWIERVD